MLLLEGFPYYGQPMALQISSETDISLVRSGPLKDNFTLWAAGLLAKSSQEERNYGLNTIGAPPPGGVDTPLTVTSKQYNEALDPVPFQNVVLTQADYPGTVPGRSGGSSHQ